jgi:hypothetical protein
MLYWEVRLDTLPAVTARGSVALTKHQLQNMRFALPSISAVPVEHHLSAARAHVYPRVALAEFDTPSTTHAFEREPQRGALEPMA